MSELTTTETERSPNPSTMPDRRSGAVFTIPNAICVLRLIGSPCLIWLAVAGRPTAFLALYLFLAFSDWLDGKLAILLNQRSKFGPKLDTISDVAMYACLVFGIVWLKSDLLRAEAGWLVAGILTYMLSVGISLAKFRSLPSYHTRAAKVSWLLAIIAIIALFLEWSVWPFRVAAAAVVVTNLEASLMSLLLRNRQTDVATIFHALAHDRSRSRDPQSTG